VTARRQEQRIRRGQYPRSFFAHSEASRTRKREGNPMRQIELEGWVHRIIDRVEQGLPVEDARVELKSEWPEPSRAARGLAGHANAAGAEAVLWVIGVDERTGAVGADRTRVNDWLPQVYSQFESLYPQLLKDLNIPRGEKVVVALLFDSTRAPHVVKNPK